MTIRDLRSTDPRATHVHGRTLGGQRPFDPVVGDLSLKEAVPPRTWTAKAHNPGSLEEDQMQKAVRRQAPYASVKPELPDTGDSFDFRSLADLLLDVGDLAEGIPVTVLAEGPRSKALEAVLPMVCMVPGANPRERTYVMEDSDRNAALALWEDLTCCMLPSVFREMDSLSPVALLLLQDLAAAGSATSTADGLGAWREDPLAQLAERGLITLCGKTLTAKLTPAGAAMTSVLQKEVRLHRTYGLVNHPEVPGMLAGVEVGGSLPISAGKIGKPLTPGRGLKAQESSLRQRPRLHHDLHPAPADAHQLRVRARDVLPYDPEALGQVGRAEPVPERVSLPALADDGSGGDRVGVFGEAVQVLPGDRQLLQVRETCSEGELPRQALFEGGVSHALPP